MRLGASGLGIAGLASACAFIIPHTAVLYGHAGSALTGETDRLTAEIIPANVSEMNDHLIVLRERMESIMNPR